MKELDGGFIYVLHNQEQVRMCGGINPTNETSRNITGELEAFKMAVRYAIANGLNKVKGHSNNKLNDIVNSLAKLGTTL